MRICGSAEEKGNGDLDIQSGACPDRELHGGLRPPTALPLTLTLGGGHRRGSKDTRSRRGSHLGESAPRPPRGSPQGDTCRQRCRPGRVGLLRADGERSAERRTREARGARPDARMGRHGACGPAPRKRAVKLQATSTRGGRRPCASSHCPWCRARKSPTLSEPRPVTAPASQSDRGQVSPLDLRNRWAGNIP